MTWAPFEGGASIGLVGSEGGTLEHDEEHGNGARISLEAGGRAAPFAITCGIYGWMVHTRFFSARDAAEQQYSLMKPALSQILDAIHSRDLRDEEYHEVTDRIEAFVEMFP